MNQTQTTIEALAEGQIFEANFGIFEFISVHLPASVPFPSYDARRLVDVDKTTGVMTRTQPDEGGNPPTQTLDHGETVYVLSFEGAE